MKRLEKINKVSVFGLGKSGISAIKALKKLGKEVYAVNQGNPSDWANAEEVTSLIGRNNCFSENDAASIFTQSELIILSPGIPTTHPVLEKALTKKIPLWSEIELGFELCRNSGAKILAITGTNGKTTTTTLTDELFRAVGFKTFLGGNIGIPFCDIAFHTPVDWVILEVSSFQLETIHEFHPSLAAILNVTPNHGERYQGIEDYRAAKLRISLNMKKGDSLLIPGEEKFIVNWSKQQNCAAESVAKENIKELIEKKYSLEKFKLVGRHNLENLYFALRLVELALERPEIQKKEIQSIIDSFKGVAHRIEYVGEFQGLKVYNDAKSTNFEATQTAVNSFQGEKNLYLILGGKKRGNNDSILPHLSKLKGKVKTVFLIGEMGNELASELQGQMNFLKLETLTKVLQYCKEEKLQGVLLFSPAFPSFDQFKNYVHRGESFKQLAHQNLER